jgi:hypothetical protein
VYNFWVNLLQIEVKDESSEVKMIDSQVLRIDDLELLFYNSYLYYTTISVDKTEKIYERFNNFMV